MNLWGWSQDKVQLCVQELWGLRGHVLTDISDISLYLKEPNARLFVCLFVLTPVEIKVIWSWLY